MTFDIQTISMIVVTLATVILAWLTYKYVRLTKYMVDDNRRSREPNINVDFELPDYRFRLVINNSGLSPAKNIKIKVIKDLKWFQGGKESNVLTDLAPIKNGISYMVPGRILKYYIGYLRWKEIKEEDMCLSLNIKFQNETGKAFQQQIDIDMSQYKTVLYESFKDPTKTIAEAIMKTDDRRRFEERSKNMFLMRNSPNKQCPVCGELVMEEAKKCIHCGEWFEKKDKDGK